MAARRTFWKWHCWLSIRYFPYTQVMCYWNLDFIFNAKLKLESGNWKMQYGHQAAILKVTLVKIDRLFSTHTCNLLQKFGLDIQSHTKVKSPETGKSNMAARQPFWKWHHWKSTGFGPWPQTTCIWNFKLKFQSKLELCSENHATHRVQIQKIQYGHQAAILKVTLLKINRLLSIYTSDVPVKFGLDIQRKY